MPAVASPALMAVGLDRHPDWYLAGPGADALCNQRANGFPYLFPSLGPYLNAGGIAQPRHQPLNVQQSPQVPLGPSPRLEHPKNPAHREP